MTKSTSVVALIAVAAVAIAWFLLGSGGVTILSPPDGHLGSTSAVQISEASEAGPSATAVEDKAPEPRAPRVTTPNERSANEAKKISDAFERGVTSTFVDYLVSKGASREDSERVVADAMREVASCVQNAVPTQPPDGAAPVEAKLGDVPMKLLGQLSSDGIGACMQGVQQRIGLPPNVMYGLNLRGSTIEFTATVLPE